MHISRQTVTFQLGFGRDGIYNERIVQKYQICKYQVCMFQYHKDSRTLGDNITTVAIAGGKGLVLIDLWRLLLQLKQNLCDILRSNMSRNLGANT